MQTATELLVWGIVLHLVGDWLFQNDWMAFNKMSLRHPAGYVHAAIHAGLLLLIFPWYAAFVVGVTHMLIDTRKPTIWWMKHIKQMTTEGPHVVMVEIWLDQVEHVVILAIAALVLATWFVGV